MVAHWLQDAGIKVKLCLVERHLDRELFLSQVRYAFDKLELSAQVQVLRGEPSEIGLSKLYVDVELLVNNVDMSLLHASSLDEQKDRNELPQ